MSLPVNRDTTESIMRDMLNRIRALEAKRHSGGFGESVELEQPGQVFATSPETIEFDEVYDPHGFFAGGTFNTTITVPAGLAGIYQFSMVWRLEAE